MCVYVYHMKWILTRCKTSKHVRVSLAAAAARTGRTRRHVGFIVHSVVSGAERAVRACGVRVALLCREPLV